MRFYMLTYVSQSEFSLIDIGTYEIADGHINVKGVTSDWQTSSNFEASYMADIRDGELFITAFDEEETLVKGEPSGIGGFDPYIVPAPGERIVYEPEPQTTTADSWGEVEPGVYGGNIKVGETVTGVISRDKNYHKFTLPYTEMESSDYFGIKLVLTADMDEDFEVFLSETIGGFEGYSEWFQKSVPGEGASVTTEGRTVTIITPVQKYVIEDIAWQFNCPEYQWGDGPDDPNPSNMKLNFSFTIYRE
jgi:hypothetical protein